MTCWPWRCVRGCRSRWPRPILDEVGQPVSDLFPDGADAPPEQQLRDFQEFLRDVSPEDFDR